MTKQTERHIKTLVGRVVSTGMTHTVKVEVTTFKVHPLYHKRYRWTKKYLSDTGELTPGLGDTVRIEATKPMSAHKRWIVAEVVTSVNEAQPLAKKATAAKKTTKKAAKKKA